MITHVDLNWFNGSVEELERKYVVGDNFYPNKVETDQIANQGILEVNNGAKTRPVPQTLNIYRGDFQESFNQRRMIQPQNERIARRNRKAIPKSYNHLKEEQWISEYFLQ